LRRRNAPLRIPVDSLGLTGSSIDKNPHVQTVVQNDNRESDNGRI
jgi:hypothetical protein